MRPHELAEQLLEMDNSKPIVCQVVGEDGGAWNMCFKVVQPEHTSLTVLSVSHPDLKTLPKIEFGGGTTYDGT